MNIATAKRPTNRRIVSRQKLELLSSEQLQKRVKLLEEKHRQKLERYREQQELNDLRLDLYRSHIKEYGICAKSILAARGKAKSKQEPTNPQVTSSNPKSAIKVAASAKK